MTVHAFADESYRGSTYLMAVALVDPADLDVLRRRVRSLLLPGQRELHCFKESAARRRLIVSTLADAGARAMVYSRQCHRRDQERARQDCLDRLVVDMLKAGTHRLVLDSRKERNHHDEATIRSVLGNRPQDSGLTYEHLDSAHELLLGVADTVAWCYGAGGDWRRRIAPVVSKLIKLDRP